MSIAQIADQPRTLSAAGLRSRYILVSGTKLPATKEA